MKRVTSLLLAIVLMTGLLLGAVPSVSAASKMTVSDDLVSVVKKFEGFHAEPYWDYQQWTVGYGTKCPADMLEEYKENGITKEAAEVLLRNTLAKFENKVNKFIDTHSLNLNQNQFDALVCFTYNCGAGWMSETSGTMYNAIVKGKTGSELIRAFTLWCSAGGQILAGLVRRRLCEANMYLNEAYSTKAPENFGYVYYDANGGSVSYRIQGYNADETPAPAYKPTKSGADFLGWYTAKTGGKKVTKLTSSHFGDTLYARWDEPEIPAETVPENAVKVVVTGTEVNLRSGPGTNYDKVGTVKKGDELVITETAEGTNYLWGNTEGKWIALQYTNYDEVVNGKEETTDPTTKPTEPAETTEPTEPTESTEPTDPTEPTEPTEPTQPTTPTEPAQQITGKVNATGGLAVREGPGTGYAIIKYLKHGTAVTITQQKEVDGVTWGYVGEGWVSMYYIVLDTEPETTEPTEPEETTKPTQPTEPTKPEDQNKVDLTGKVDASGGLALREGPGKTYKVLKYLKNGAAVTVTALVEKDGVTWGKVGEGWVSMEYIALDIGKPSVSLKNDAESGKPVLSWKAVKNAAEYQVYRATSKSGKYSKIKTTTKLSYTDTSASAGKKYYYKVRGVGINGDKGSYSTADDIYCDLAQPKLKVSNTASSGKTKLSWSKVSGAKKYYVYRATSKTGSYTRIKSTTSTSYTDSDASVGKTYYYKVKAIASTSSANSAYSEILKSKRICAQPDLVVKISTTTGKPSLSWDKVSGAKEYKVYRATSKSGDYKLIKTTTSTSYKDTSAKVNDDYYYRVDVIGKTSGTDSKKEDPIKVHTTCAKPSVSIKLSSNKPKVSWKAVDGATKYYVYRATSKSGKYTKVKTTTSTSYTDKTAKKGKTYYYKVKAVASSSSGNSAYSSVVSIKSK